MINNFLEKNILKSSPYIIAEIGINHNGNLELAKKMILSAKKSGANCVKFQKFVADDYISKYAGKAKYQSSYSKFKKKSQLEIIRESQLDINQIIYLKNFAKKNKIDFLCTPFEIGSLKELIEIGMPAIKISSDNVNNILFLKEASKSKLPILLSTGMSTFCEVKKAVSIFKKNQNPLLLFQCTSNYPSNIKNSNVAVLSKFKNFFNCQVGLSDHTNSIVPAIIAVSLGAVAIEKHFTISRKLPGIDQKASLEPHELKLLITKCKEAKLALGTDEKKVTKEEKNTINAARRSIVLNVDLEKGMIIKKGMIEIKRPGTGISPDNYKKIVGKKLLFNKKKDQILQWRDIQK